MRQTNVEEGHGIEESRDENAPAEREKTGCGKGFICHNTKTRGLKHQDGVDEWYTRCFELQEV